MGRFWRALVIFEVAVLLFVAMLSYILVEGQAVTRFAYEFSDYRPLAVYATNEYIITAGGRGGPAVVVVNRTSGALVKSWYYSANDPNSCDIAFDGSYVYVGCVRYSDYVFLGKYSYSNLNAVWERMLSGVAYSVIDIDANNGNLYFVIRGYAGSSDFIAGYYSSDGGGFVVKSVSLSSDYTDVIFVSGVIGTGYYDQLGLCGFAKFTYSGTTYNTLFYLEIALGSGTVYKNVMVQVPSVPSTGYNLVEALNGSRVVFNVGRYVAVFNRDTNAFESVRSISISGISYYYDSDIEIYGSNLYMAIRYYNSTLSDYMIAVVKFDTEFNVLASYGYSGTYNNFYDFASYGDNIAVVNAAGSYYMFYAPLGIEIPYKVVASGVSASFTAVSTTSYSISYSFGTPSVSANTISSSALSLSTGYLYLDIVTTVTNTVTTTTTNTVTTTNTATETETVTNVVTTTAISAVTSTGTVTETVTTTAVHAVPYPYTVTEIVTTTVYSAGPAVDIYVVVFIVAALIAVAVVYSYRRK